MTERQLGSLIGAVFGFIYVLVNAGALPAAVGSSLQLLGGVAFVAVLMAILRGRHRGRSPRRGRFGRGYWFVVAGEVVALAGGLAVLNGPLDAPQAGVAWVSVVVGLHFVALAAVFRQAFFNWLGGAIAVCGSAGLVLIFAGTGEAPVASVSGVVPGGLLLAAAWWGARAENERQPPRPSERPRSAGGGEQPAPAASRLWHASAPERGSGTLP